MTKVFFSKDKKFNVRACSYTLATKAIGMWTVTCGNMILCLISSQETLLTWTILAFWKILCPKNKFDRTRQLRLPMTNVNSPVVLYYEMYCNFNMRCKVLNKLASNSHWKQRKVNNFSHSLNVPKQLENSGQPRKTSQQIHEV